MADIKQDLLGLEYSASFTLQGIQEADINLELPPVSGGSATVYGTVTDGTDPLADATVKLFDSTGAPFQHTLTDASGQYSMSGIPAGTYTIAAVKDGYRLSGALGVTLAASDTTQMNLTCTADATLTLGAIAGTITGGSIANVTMSLTVDTRTYNGTVSGVIRDQKDTAVAGCFVGLYQITGTGAGATETLIATTKTNAEGKYLFGGVVGGQYLVKAKLEQ